MKFGIDPHDLDAIIDLFKKYPSISRVRVFGSRALSTQRPGSDLDLAVEGAAINLALFHSIQEDYEKLYLPWRLDLVSYSDLDNAALKEHIDRVGIEIYRSP
jgi:predicted nucleotidyltransferase